MTPVNGFRHADLNEIHLITEPISVSSLCSFPGGPFRTEYNKGVGHQSGAHIFFADVAARCNRSLMAMPSPISGIGITAMPV